MVFLMLWTEKKREKKYWKLQVWLDRVFIKTTHNPRKKWSGVIQDNVWTRIISIMWHNNMQTRRKMQGKLYTEVCMDFDSGTMAIMCALAIGVIVPFLHTYQSLVLWNGYFDDIPPRLLLPKNFPVGTMFYSFPSHYDHRP